MNNTKFRVHDSNLQCVWDCLTAGKLPEVWLHGDGMVFPVFVYNPLEGDKQDDSKNHAESTNRGPNGHEEREYRVKITKATMPKSVDEAIRMLQTAKMREDTSKDAIVNNVNSRVTNIRQSETDFRQDIHEPAGEIDYTNISELAKFNHSKKQDA
jgi:hypothetical protein